MNRLIDTLDAEREFREQLDKRIMPFGVPYLDDAFGGILPNDLILLGADSGAGKTQLCTHIAGQISKTGKRVDYVALEAQDHEITHRIKYQIFANEFYNDPNRPRIKISFRDWMRGRFLQNCAYYEDVANQKMREQYSNLFVKYKRGKFDVADMVQYVDDVSKESSLVILDHAHYFDYDDTKENSSLKLIAKQAREMAIEVGVPIMLVAHLRKPDRNDKSIVPHKYDFHGSSDLYKIATKTILFARGEGNGGIFSTYFRLDKGRFEGDVVNYIAKMFFNLRRLTYEQDYKLGNHTCERNKFEELDRSLYPEWAKTPK